MKAFKEVKKKSKTQYKTFSSGSSHSSTWGGRRLISAAMPIPGRAQPESGDQRPNPIVGFLRVNRGQKLHLHLQTLSSLRENFSDPAQRSAPTKIRTRSRPVR